MLTYRRILCVMVFCISICFGTDLEISSSFQIAFGRILPFMFITITMLACPKFLTLNNFAFELKIIIEVTVRPF